MEKKYKDLALRQDLLKAYLKDFFTRNPHIEHRDTSDTNGKMRITLGHIGQSDATVDLFFKKGGTTSVLYKVGKNYELGIQLADHLYSTVNPDESTTVNLSLKGVSDENVQILIDELNADVSSGISITSHPQTHSVRYEICSKYRDRLIVTHHTTNVLQVQGKPLFCYRSLIYFLSVLLDQAALMSVISKTADEDKLLVREDVACVHVEGEYPNSYSRMDSAFKNLLVSSYCVKLASPTLPEYSMLLYGDLRVLEGVTKKVLASYGLHTDTASPRRDVGAYFDVAKLKDKYLSAVESGVVGQLEECYQLYKIQRHALFHMSDIAFNSRVIDSLVEVMRLSKDIANKTDAMYMVCDKL